MNRTNVVIIGAGLSGLRAASVFLAHPQLRVTVLEGRDRIGGRTHTSSGHSWRTPLDYGCAWIHGTEKNPLTPIATACHSQFYELETPAIHHRDEWLSSRETTRIFDFVFGIGKEAVQYSKDHKDDIPVDQSLYDFCLRRIAEEPDFGALDRERARKLVHFYTNITAAEVTEQSLRNYLLEEELPGNSPLLATTYAPLVEKIAQPVLNADILEYKQRVTKITSLPDDRLLIHSECTQTGVTKRITADVVLCTVPLGVLKADKIAFSPSLPIHITSAIKNLGMGTAEKCFIKMNKAFWLREKTLDMDRPISRYPYNADMFAFLPDDDASQPLIELISLASFPVNREPVLLCYSAANVAEMLARKWHEEGADGIKSYFLPFIAKLPGYTPDCQIEDVCSTQWLTDEFSLGSYSFSPKGAEDTISDCDAFARGVPERNLFFAGEHCASKTTGYEIGASPLELSSWTSTHITRLLMVRIVLVNMLQIQYFNT